MVNKQLSELRDKICTAMKAMEENWSTTDSILAKMQSDGMVNSRTTLEKVGNNLRVLKNEGVVADTKVDGRRCWSLTGKEYEANPPVRMVVAFPKKVHEAMSEAAAKRGVSRTNFVIKSVKDTLGIE